MNELRKPLREYPDEARRLHGLPWASFLGHEASKAAGVHVLLPCAALLAAGFAVVLRFQADDWAGPVGQGLITGAILTGGFGWIEALNGVIQAERSRQIDLGTADSLHHADLANLALTGMYLRHADLRGARLSGAKAEGIDLHGADLTDARLTKAVLHNADFTNATLVGAGCYQADLTGADLRWADLRGASLGEALLAGADLRGADCRKADLRGATLTDVAIDAETQFGGAWVSEAPVISMDSRSDSAISGAFASSAVQKQGRTLLEFLGADVQTDNEGNKGARCYCASEKTGVGIDLRESETPRGQPPLRWPSRGKETCFPVPLGDLDPPDDDPDPPAFDLVPPD